MAKHVRMQAPKRGNRYANAERTKAVQERRFSNAAGPHKMGTDYQRKGKYGYNYGDDE